MRLDICFLSPDRPRYKAAPAAHRIPTITSCPDGRFLFNLAAHDMLELRAGLHMLFGHEVADPREWFLRVATQDGFLLTINGYRGGQPRFAFKSKPQRQAILDTLPHAPAEATLRFVLDEMPLTGPDDEAIWPLLTAPYWQPQVPVRKESLLKPDPFAGAPVHGLYRVLKTVQL